MPIRQIPERPAPRRPRGSVTAFLAVELILIGLAGAGFAGILAHLTAAIFAVGWTLIP